MKIVLFISLWLVNLPEVLGRIKVGSVQLFPTDEKRIP